MRGAIMENGIETFELMTKMYSEFKIRFDGIDSRLDAVERELAKKADKLDIIRLENKQDNDAKALYDGYIQNHEKLIEVEKKIDDIALKVEKQDVEITVIKGGRKVSTK